MRNKRGQVVTGIFVGIVAIILTAIIGFVVVQSVTESNLLPSTEPTLPFVQTNETKAFVGNGTTYITDESHAGIDGNTSNSNYVLTDAWTNFSGSPTYSDQLNTTWLGKLSLNGTGYLTNTSVLGNASTFTDILLSYTFTSISGSLPAFSSTVDNLTANLSSGVNRVSEKVPTILKIAAVVLLIGVLVLLTLQARKMGLFEGGSGGL